MVRRREQASGAGRSFRPLRAGDLTHACETMAAAPPPPEPSASSKLNQDWNACKESNMSGRMKLSSDLHARPSFRVGFSFPLPAFQAPLCGVPGQTRAP